MTTTIQIPQVLPGCFLRGRRARRRRSGENACGPVSVVTVKGERSCWFGSVVTVKGERACWLLTVMREARSVRAVEADTAGWRAGRATWRRTLGYFGWSSEDGYRSQGGDEEGEDAGEMHAGCFCLRLDRGGGGCVL